MAVAFYLMFLHIPFVFAFHRDLEAVKWCRTVSLTLNVVCFLDLFVNFFTGFKTDGNYVVLRHRSIIRLILETRLAAVIEDFE